MRDGKQNPITDGLETFIFFIIFLYVSINGVLYMDGAARNTSEYSSLFFFLTKQQFP